MENTSQENIIFEGTVIEGNVITPDSITLKGEINGNISAKGLVCLDGGIIHGDIEGNSVLLKSAKVIGKVTAYETFAMLDNSVMKGDLTAKEASIDGIIAGNITVDGLMSLGSKAIVSGGDIRCKLQTMDEGASISGNFIQETRTGESIDSLIARALGESCENEISKIKPVQFKRRERDSQAEEETVTAAQ